MGEGDQVSKAGGGDKTQRIAMKIGMLVIGLDENVVSVDELAQRKMCFNTLMAEAENHTTRTHP